jgi:hypothetical protein
MIRVVHPGSGSWIRILIFTHPPDPGSKRHRIPYPQVTGRSCTFLYPVAELDESHEDARQAARLERKRLKREEKEKRRQEKKKFRALLAVNLMDEGQPPPPPTVVLFSMLGVYFFPKCGSGLGSSSYTNICRIYLKKYIKKMKSKRFICSRILQRPSLFFYKISSDLC